MSSESISAVLGDGAILMHRVACALDTARTRLTAYRGGPFERDLRARPYEELQRLGADMDALGEAMSSELSREHDAVTAFADARSTVVDAVQALDLVKDADSGKDPDIRNVADKVLDQIEERRSHFDACRDRFMGAVREVRDKQ